MRVMVLPDDDAVAERAARLVSDLVSVCPQAVLGLAAGASPVGLYRRLVAAQRAGTIDLSAITAIGLDDYVGLPAGHPASCRHCIEAHLLDPLGIPPQRRHLLGAMAGDDLAARCAGHERIIAALGGIDLQILGIGVNGHIGFNEPGAPFGGRTRAVALAATTRAVNLKDFAPGEAVPAMALTMGIATILDARRIVLLASGAGKADALAAALEGPVSPAVPASALRGHSDVTVLADEAAAGRLLHNG